MGYGHLCVEDHWEDDKEYEWGYLEEILIADLREAIAGADELIEQHNCKDLEAQAKEIMSNPKKYGVEYDEEGNLVVTKKFHKK